MKQTIVKKKRSAENAWHRVIFEETQRIRSQESQSMEQSVKAQRIMPVPPENLYSVVLVEGSTVHTDYEGRGLTGVVIKKMEDGNYLVYFDVLPDIVEFERKHLRAHLHWTGSEWVQAEVKELSKSMFSPGTLVEVRFFIGNGDVSWVPAMIIKEIEKSGLKKLILKVCNKSFRFVDGAKIAKIADLSRVRPTPPPVSVEEYKLLDCVEMFHGSGWCQGIVMKVLDEKSYMVSLKARKESLLVKHMELRPVRVWEDGVWHNRSVLAESENRKRKREKAGKLGLNDTLGTGSKAEICDKGKSICNDDDVNDQLQSPNVVNSFAADVEGAAAQMISPFAKTLPFWKTCETNELYNRVPQTPHFSPLFDVNEDLREMSAIGMTGTFYGLLEEVKSLQLDVSSSKLNSLLSCLATLEKHGFNVANPQSRLSKVLSLQTERAKKAESRKVYKDLIKNNEIAREKVVEEMAELERTIENLDKCVVKQKICVGNIDEDIKDLELEFQTTVSAAW